MRATLYPLLLAIMFAAVASAQLSLPFTITNFTLPLTVANSTYVTNVTSVPGGTATVNGAGFSNQQATVSGTGVAARERGLNCGGAIQLSITFAFDATDAITALAVAPLAKNATSANLTFSVTGGTGLFQGVGGSGTMAVTLAQSSASTATVSGTGSGTLVLGAAPAPAMAPSGIVPIYSSVPIVQPGSWISIYGANFASSLSVWNGDFPQKLGNVSVTIDNKPAYIWFVSPGQINVQVPDDNVQGCVNVSVTTPNGTANSQVTLQPAQPSFSLWSGTQYAIGFIRPSDGSYVYLGPSSGLPVAAKAAHVGDVVELYGVGFGPIAHPVPAGQVDSVSGQNATNDQVSVTVGGKPATLLYAGLSQAGAYQLDFIVPQVPTGDNLIVATVNAPNPLLFSSFSTPNCASDTDPQGPVPTTCNIYIPVQ